MQMYARNGCTQSSKLSLSLPSGVVLLLSAPLPVWAPRRAAATAAMPRAAVSRAAPVPVVPVVPTTLAAALLAHAAVAALCARIAAVAEVRERQAHAPRSSTPTDDAVAEAASAAAARTPRALRLAVSNLSAAEALHAALVGAAPSRVLLHGRVSQHALHAAVNVRVVGRGAVAAEERSGREGRRRAIDVTERAAHIAVHGGEVPEGQRGRSGAARHVVRRRTAAVTHAGQKASSSALLHSAQRRSREAVRSLRTAVLRVVVSGKCRLSRICCLHPQQS